MRLCYLLPDEAKDRESYRVDVRFRQHTRSTGYHPSNTLYYHYQKATTTQPSRDQARRLPKRNNTKIEERVNWVTAIIRTIPKSWIQLIVRETARKYHQTSSLAFFISKQIRLPSSLVLGLRSTLPRLVWIGVHKQSGSSRQKTILRRLLDGSLGNLWADFLRVRGEKIA